MINIKHEKTDYQGQYNLKATSFNIGQFVELRSNPMVYGVIVGITLGEPENRYDVFVNGITMTYYFSQLQPREKVSSKFEIVPLSQFHAHLSALQISHPGLSTLYSLNAARIDFIPYQFRPVLKFICSDQPRLLIADDVGVGKTIEAGLILRELQARCDIKSVLIICPRPLVTECKWKIEMKRFEEHFAHLDGKTLHYCVNEMDLDGVWPSQYSKVILPYSLLDEALLYGVAAGKRKHRKGLLDLDPPPRFDLVIVDEAHHIRNPNTYAYKAVRFFCENAEAVLFLTATPIQLGSDDLFVLLNVLRPDLIIDKESFEHMAAPNPHINHAIDLIRAQEENWQEKAKAALDDAVFTPWGQSILKNNPEFQRVINLVIKDNITLEERIEAIRLLEQLHTFSGIINRTRRRDIGDFTVRKPETVTVEFTQQQSKLHDYLLDLQSKIISRVHGDKNVKFMMTTIRRQASSCLNGLSPLIKEILTRHLDEFAWDEIGDMPESFDINAISKIEEQILDVQKQAEQLDTYDPKLESLRKIVLEKQNMKNNKIMVFSSFRHTLRYLYNHLKKDGLRVAMVDGSTFDEDRVQSRNRFRLPKEEADALDILLFSEVGCEGLDYQFCDCIVNYDLPWNPMKIEQRIGRIDRKGQQSETISIYNLITPGTVDADIYERCLLRIGVFNRALGGSEEILGRVTQEICDVAENFKLTEEERREKLQQIADNEVRFIQEQEELEKKQVEFFGIKLPTEQIQQDIDNASSYWLSPPAIQNLVNQYLQDIGGQEEQEFILGKKSLKTLRLAEKYRNLLLQDFQALPRKSSIPYHNWENWLKSGDPHLPITFDSTTAAENPKAEFITPLHPLVQQAARSFKNGKCIMTAITVTDNSIASGIYPFAIYEWHFHGIREDIVLQPLTEFEEINSQLSKLIERGQPSSLQKSEFPNVEVFENLDTYHYKLWVKARNVHLDRTRQIASYRRESLSTSHRARMELLTEQLAKATDEKIQRMRQSQIASAEADYARRIQELDLAIEKADLTAKVVAFGILQVKGGSKDGQ